MKIWSRRIAQNINEIFLKNSALSIQGKNFLVLAMYIFILKLPDL